MNKGLKILLGLLAAVVLLALAVVWYMLDAGKPPAQMPDAEPAASAAAEPTAVPARGYVRVTAGSESRWFPLPEEGEVSFNVRQQSGDEELVNLIHLTPEGAYMEASTCHNQDCVEQGMVTLENRETRVLGNWIICLPNQVSIELFTPDEIVAMGE